MHGQVHGPPRSGDGEAAAFELCVKCVDVQRPALLTKDLLCPRPHVVPNAARWLNRHGPGTAPVFRRGPLRNLERGKEVLQQGLAGFETTLLLKQRAETVMHVLELVLDGL